MSCVPVHRKGAMLMWAGLCSVFLLCQSCSTPSQQHASADIANLDNSEDRGKNYFLLEMQPTVRLVLQRQPDFGDSLKQCREKVGFDEKSAKELVADNPFLDFMPAASTVMWVFEKDKSIASRIYLFGVFEDSRMLKLVDLIEYSNGVKFPRIHGRYHTALAGVKRGMNVRDLFHQCGSQTCEYLTGAEGTARIRFAYTGVGQSMFVIEADASTGEILSAVDAGI